MALYDSGALVANVALSDTFNSWRVTTNKINTQAAGLASNNTFTGTLNTFNNTAAFNGAVTAPTVTANTFSGGGASLTGLNASNISTGTLASARLPDLAVSDFAGAAIQTGSEGFSDSDTVLMTAAAVQDKILSYGYTTTSGTVTSVTVSPGTAMDGGGTITSSGTVTLNLDLSELSTSTTNGDGDYFVVVDTSNAQRKLTKGNINLSGFNNDSGFQTSSGSVASATNATNSTNFNVAADNTTNATHYPVFVGGATGNQRPNSDTGLTYNPSSGQMTAVDFNATSDRNLKENIQTLENASQKISQMRGVSFDWKKSGLPSIGLIAQEVEEIIPEVISETDGIKSISYGSLVGLLIEAVKELQDKVSELEKR